MDDVQADEGLEFGESTTLVIEELEQAFAAYIGQIIEDPAHAPPEQQEFAELIEQAVRASREENIEGLLMLAARMVTCEFSGERERETPLATHLALLLNTVGRLELVLAS